MAVRLLSGVRPGRTAQRHSRHLRPGSRRFRGGVAGLLGLSLAGRLPGMARSAGLDSSEIRDVGARRAVPISRGQPVKYATNRPFADPEKAARKLLEIANETEAVQDGRIHIEKINGPFLFRDGGSPAGYGAGLAYAIEKGWLWSTSPALT
jgi:hypothetical protein